MKETCAKCGIKAKEGANLDTPGIVFNFLHLAPFVCERCVFAVLMNGYAEPFSEQIENLLESGIEETK